MKRLLLAAFTALALPAAAQDRPELRIAVEAGPTSLDPHYASLITNIAFARHVFQPLAEQDQRQVLRPAIARSWRVVDDTTWELELDPNARFSDGRPVTVEDIAFTIARAGDVPNSPSSFRYATRPVAAVDVDEGASAESRIKSEYLGAAGIRHVRLQPDISIQPDEMRKRIFGSLTERAA